MTNRSLAFTPLSSTVHKVPALVVGDKVKVTTTYTYCLNHIRTGTVIEIFTKTADGKPSYVVDYDYGPVQRDYVCDSPYYRVTVLSRFPMADCRAFWHTFFTALAEYMVIRGFWSYLFSALAEYAPNSEQIRPHYSSKHLKPGMSILYQNRWVRIVEIKPLDTVMEFWLDNGHCGVWCYHVPIAIKYEG